VRRRRRRMWTWDLLCLVLAARRISGGRLQMMIGAVEIDQRFRIGSHRKARDLTEEHAVRPDRLGADDPAIEADGCVLQHRRAGRKYAPGAGGKAIRDAEPTLAEQT